MITILFTFSGIVQRNLGRGNQLGFPTANIDVAANTEEGIFVAITEYKGNKYPSVLFIGPSVTFNETDKKAEIYILDFDENIYGKTLSIKVLKKLRVNEKFTTVENLIEKMKTDEQNAREFFKGIADNE
ncbi:MAG TPA: riboflavin kinase [Candidatus Woesebacteria bacterium]|nr:riboflavin kinase [Candidatus Woesebacteria bacterium]